MLAPMSLNMTSSLPDTASVSIRPETTTPTVPLTNQTEKNPAPTGQQNNRTDTVALSETAVDMSKALNQQADKRSELKKEAARKEDQSPEKASKAYLAAGKQYPPFMGNGEELKALKEASPALYREILRMIVPPPLNISPTDLQALKGSTARSSKAESTIA
ncbi:MAG: hypothetical protein FIA89_01940 [Geobacter sp.]|nr:hypothetical protein [Geobacter sp.]